MKKILILALALFGMTPVFGQNSLGEVLGEVVDKDGAPIWDAHVFIDDVFGQRYQAKTGTDGRFRISGIPAGEYLMNVRQYEDTMKNILVDVPSDGFFQAGEITFEGGLAKILEKEAIVITVNRNGLIDGNLPVKELSAEEIQQRPDKFDIKSMLSTMSSDIQLTADNEIVIRGARPGDLLYLVDGVKAAEIGSIPSAGIGRINVYTGGIPAKYGDTMGGVVVMETQSYFDLYRAWRAQELKAGN